MAEMAQAAEFWVNPPPERVQPAVRKLGEDEAISCQAAIERAEEEEALRREMAIVVLVARRSSQDSPAMILALSLES